MECGAGKASYFIERGDLISRKHRISCPRWRGGIVFIHVAQFPRMPSTGSRSLARAD